MINIQLDLQNSIHRIFTNQGNMCLTAGSEHCLTIQGIYAGLEEEDDLNDSEEQDDLDGYEDQNDLDDSGEEDDSNVKDEIDDLDDSNIEDDFDDSKIENDLDDSIREDDSEEQDDLHNSEEQDNSDENPDLYDSKNDDFDIAQELMKRYKNLGISVKHMKNFNKYLLGKKVNHKQELRDFILKAYPKFNMIIMPWCYSYNGDVCMAFRKDPILW